MEKAIVTGCAGFVGSHLAERLVDEGFEVYGIDNFHTYYSEDIKRQNLGSLKNKEGFSFVEGSILDEDDLDKLPSNPEAVFHQAAIAGVRNSIDKPSEYVKQNVLATSKILDKFRDSKIVFASSSSVYGNKEEEELPAKEDDDLDPIAPYPLSKMQCEQMIELYSELYDIDYAILRYFTVYGPRQRPDEAFTKFLSMALNNKPLTVYGDGEQSRDFTHVSDVVRANLLAYEKGSGTYNIGSGRRITVDEMVEAIREVVPREVEKKHVESPQGDARHTHADISKAEEELGYRPEKGFEEGVQECFDWCREMHRRNLL